MAKKTYTSPDFQFQELFLFEGVANTCWGFHHADFLIFYDRDVDDIYDSDETVIFEHSFIPSEGGSGEGCNNVQVAISNAIESIHQAFIDNGFERYWNNDVVNTIKSKENVGDSAKIYIPIHS